MTSRSSQIAELKIPKGTLSAIRNVLCHWHEHRPKMYTELYNNGTLMETATAAYETAGVDAEEIQENLEEEYGAPTAFIMAKRIADERYLYLPTEEDVPNLMETNDGIPIYQSDQSG